MKHLLRLIVLATTALSLLMVADPPSHAASRSKTDPSGDAPVRQDITKVSVRYPSNRAKVAVRLRNVGRTGAVHVGIFGYDLYGYSFVIRRRNGHVSVRRTDPGQNDRVAHPRRAACNGTGEWDMRNDIVRLSIPYRCITWHDGIAKDHFGIWTSQDYVAMRVRRG